MAMADLGGGPKIFLSEGDDTYLAVFPWGLGFPEVYAGGGVDTFSGKGATLELTVDLSTGSASAAAPFSTYKIADFESIVGGTLSDTLIGSAAANLIRGGGGDDSIEGGAGRDTLQGGAGADTLVGGMGGDVLTGGDGADDFKFTGIGEAKTGRVVLDTINDFHHGGSATGDDIDLHLIDARAGVAGNQTFTFIGDEVFHGIAGELRFRQSGSHVIVEGDVTGDGHADFSILVKNINTLVGSDFIL